MRIAGRGRVYGPGGRRWLPVVVAVLAACGVAGAVPSAALAGSPPGPDWTKQAPATYPSARDDTSMAYDAATGNMVLFGGLRQSPTRANSTYVWNGTTWTQQHPATTPRPRLHDTAMTYDAATGNIVLFGGCCGRLGGLGNTWTWNGKTWTLQHPATSPPPRFGASMAYDAATGTVVLFGGYGCGGGCGMLGDTWTWDGTTWTQQHPATSPSARYYESMAYDAARGNVVLFGGSFCGCTGAGMLNDTWTWDGTTWTQQVPATSPPASWHAAMTYDTATGNTVLFGGQGRTRLLGGTWTWDGTTWTKQAPATSPPALVRASMAYDAATGNVVLFGGTNNKTVYHGTWTWG